MRQRLDWVDVAKGGSIALVVVYHLSLYLDRYGAVPPVVMKTNLLLAYFRMPTFFLISGLLAGKAVRGDWPTLLGKRIATYVWLLLIWTTLHYIYFGTVIENVILPRQGHDLTLLLTALISPSTGLWFIWALAIFSLVSKALMSLPQRLLPLWLGLAALLSALAYAEVIDFESFVHNNLCLYLVFFLTGAIFPQRIIALVEGRIWQKAALAAGAFVGLLAVTRINPDILRPALGLGLAVSGCCLALLLARLLLAWERPAAVLRYLGANTLQVYVLHVPLIALLTYNLAQLGLGHTVNALMIPVLALIIIPVTLGIRALAARIGLSGLFELPSRFRFAAA